MRVAGFLFGEILKKTFINSERRKNMTVKSKMAKAVIVFFVLFISTSFCYGTTIFLPVSKGFGYHPVNGQNVSLGHEPVNVSGYKQIRLFANAKSGSYGAVSITISMYEPGPQGNVFVGILDNITLQPGQSVTRVYNVPGKLLYLTGSGTNAWVLAVLYGSAI